MGTIRELGTEGKTVHLVQTNSGKAELYVYDELKKICKATLESVSVVETKGMFNQMLELVGLQPYLADKWLFVIEYSKVKSYCKKYKEVFKSDTAIFMVKVKNYREFLEFKEIVPNCNALYLTLLRKNDISYLLKDYNLTQKVMNFVSTTYVRDPEKVFELRESLELGIEVKTNRDVVKLIGTSSGSVNKLAFDLLKDPPKTEKGFSTVYRNRIKLTNDLIQAYGVKTLKNFLTSTVKDILDIKLLYMQGIVYDSMRDIPESFNEQKLSKYGFYLETIEKNIPYERILKLYCALKEDKVWYKKQDMLYFMYNYYGGVN